MNAFELLDYFWEVCQIFYSKICMYLSRKILDCFFQVLFGSNLLLRGVYSNPGAYSIFVDSFPRPGHGHVTLILTNKNGLIAQDSFAVR